MLTWTLTMWSAPAVYMLCILTGIICNVNSVMSQPRLIQRKADRSPSEGLKIEEDIQKVINQIHSLSDDHKRTFSLPQTAEDIDLNAYYAVLNNLYNLLQSLLKEKFMEELPKILLCILSERQDCGLQAELTKTVSLELGRPLLLYLSSLKSQMCSPVSSDEDSPSFFRAYLRMGESASAALGTFPQMVLNMLPSLALSENVLNIVSSFTDATVMYMLRFMAVLLDVPVDYIRIALQFGIQVPQLDEEGLCAEGDLKQLIMWGMKNNMSWSFGVPLLDVLLEATLPQEDSPYIHQESECLNHASGPLQRSNTPTEEDPAGVNPEALCEHYNLAKFNDTLCADILSGSTVGSSTSVINFCQALSFLSPNQIQKVWSNMCYFSQQLVLPLVSRSSDCSILAERSYPTSTSAFETPSQVEAPHRAAREASNLQQLACDYNSWLQDERVDAVLVSLCSDNEHDEFVRRVCHNDLLLKKLLSDNMNSWLYESCYNSSVDPSHMVSLLCTYEQWIDNTGASVDTSLLAFCMKVDAPRLTNLFCQHTGFLMLLISNPDNWKLLPNCTNEPPPAPFPGQDLVQLESCQYSEWTDVMQITTDKLSKCILLDQGAFNKEVCTNKTFLNRLLRNPDLRWLESHCNTTFNVQYNEPPAPTPSFNITDWCDYHTWGERLVDDSVVGLCWQQDQLGFQENVCCKAPVFDKLLQNPLNKWLTSVCTDIKEITMSPQVCKYSEWGFPIIVDMTELALCAEMDPHNFTSKVCANKTVLQNLLTNQDNTWLIQHCANHSTSVVSPGGGLTGFIAAEHCQYASWRISPPDAALLTLCWEQDQTNFVTSICPNESLLSSLSLEPSSMWVSSMCTTYTNYTTTTPPYNTTTAKPSICPAQKLIQQFNWNCSTYFNSACQPCATQNMVLQTLVRCWVDSLGPRVVNVVPQSVTTVFEKAVSTTVVILLALEDVQISSWHVTDTIRQSVLKSVVDFFKTTSDADKKSVLLQCFGTALTNLLLTTRDMTSDEMAVIQEYFNLPLSSVKPVLLTAHIRTVRLILQYYSSKKDTLQLPNGYLSSMVSVLLQNHLVRDHKLFPELAPLLNSSSPTDVHGLPPLQNQPSVLEAINRNLDSMSLDLRRAFGLWYSKTMSPSDITGGHDSLIGDTGNLIAYLPFQHFQHFSAAQLFDGLEVLKRNSLSSLKQEFIARTLIGADRNLTAEDFTRLGNITCLADPEDLLTYRSSEAFGVIQGKLMNCTRQGIDLPSQLVSTLLLNSTDLQDPSSLSANRLAELVPLLPSLGVTFLQNLTVSQLHNVLPNISSTNFSPAQSWLIVDKLSSSNSLTSDPLLELGSLLIGVRTESLLSLTSDRLRSSLTSISQQTEDLCNPKTNGLSPPQANAIATKLWGFPAVVQWLNDVEPLLSCTPLLSVMSRTNVLVRGSLNLSKNSWNTQQAKAIFNEMFEINPTLIKKYFLSLGTLGQGVSCKALQELLRSSPSPSSVRNILTFLRQQPRPLHTSLKKCLIEELYRFEFFSELLEDLGSEIALSMPISMIKKFPMMDILRRMIVEDPRYFLLMPRTKQELLVDKIVQRMNMYLGVFTEEEFRSLGVMATFVADEIFIQVDRSFFIANLDFLTDLCYSSTKMGVVAQILQEEAVFGSVRTWNQSTLSQVDRLLFFLHTSELEKISPALMTVGRIEKLFMSQRQWEQTDVGIHCLEQKERKALFEKQQFVLQFFLGFLKIYPDSAPPIVPTCEMLHNTAPSAWTSSSLYSMATSAFYNCLELMGHDPFLATYQRLEVLRKLKEMLGPVSSFPESVISQLGGIATELTPEELRSISLTERRSIAAMGAVSSWNSRQLAALFATVLKSTGQSPSQLDSSTLVSLGHIVCGANITEIKAFNPIELSKAVLWLGQLNLSCSDDQLIALVKLLAHVFAFNSMSSWGTDVFIEIGVLAAGLQDMSMSALVKEQIEGIPPAAISRISPVTFSVAFDQQQISMFSYEQAAAVTDEQFAALTDVERTALAMVLTPWEDKNVDFRGRSHGLILSQNPLSLLLGPMIPLILLLCSDT